jgi:Ca2+-binding RTX toxin-like protein
VFEALNSGATGGSAILDFGAASGTAADLDYDASAGTGDVTGGRFSAQGGFVANVDQFRGTNLNDSLIVTVPGNGSRSFIFDGRGGNDQLQGGAGNDTLNGGTGADTMRGMAGNDGYVVDNAGDVVDESIAGSSGTDTVHSLISFNLAAALGNVENLILAGSANIHATGNGLNNLLVGNSGINILNGWTGNDTMRGMAGSDVYVVHNTGDIVDESVAGSNGNDIVQSYLSFSLANAATVKGSVENLLLLGAANINGTGNTLNNLLIGNAGINVLNGAAGIDTMRGIGGNDIYVVDNAGDIVDESIAGSSGIDLVQSSISFGLVNSPTVLGAVERLALTGSANINATGNALNNALWGNSGVNTLDGGAGIDTLRGGAGNDNYIVDNAGDIVDESAAGSSGIDTVYATISFDLTNSPTVLGTVERLLLQGGANLVGTGNALNNLLVGNSGANVLNGLAGSDTLIGAAGNDTFRFNSALGSTNIDTITDFSVPADTIQLDDAIFTAVGALGTLAASAFHIGAAAADALDRIIYNNVTGALIYDSNGSAAGGATQFATLDTGLAMTNADFFVV